MALIGECFEPSSLRLEELTNYLRHSGWSLEPAQPQATRLVFHSPEAYTSGPARIILPNSPDSPDLSNRIEDAMRALSLAQEQPPNAILRAIHSLRRDRVEVHLHLPPGHAPGLPLSKTSEFFSSFNSLLTATAVQESHPAPYFERATKAGAQFAQECLFSNTFEGSFGIAIHSPFLEDQPAQPHLPIAPLPRRVFQRFFTGLQTASLASLSGNPNLLANSWRTGFNANTCETLDHLLTAFEGYQLTLVPSWSRLWPAPDDLPSVQLDSAAIPTLRSAASSLRAAVPQRQITLTGTITGLLGQPSLRGNTKITAQILGEDSPTLTVFTTLTHEDYRTACDAHRDQSQVTLSGTLIKQPKGWLLTNPIGFRRVT